jgi:phosphoglycolate phosphatase-like HAD superfamily hydrolase
MEQRLLPGTQIEIVNENIERGRLKHLLFDFDGTISILREGWPEIMAPVCVEMVCGETEPTQAIIDEVNKMIDDTTGIQTIYQMECLQEMVIAHRLVPKDKVLSPAEYKQIYLDRLMVPVRARIAKLEAGEKTVTDFTVAGSIQFLEILSKRNVHMYVFSGTDQDDVRNEAGKLGAAPFFEEIWGALPSKEEYSKEKVIRDIMTRHDLHGPQVLAVGDGPVELRNVKDAGGIALGVCSNEKTGCGWDMHKRTRLLKAGADILVPDFNEAEKLVAYLFAE